MMEPLTPMLAVAAEPFDSPDYLFEIKWDGIRGLALVQQRSWRLWGRGETEYAERYPELDVLQQLPPGTILDGELVRLRGGKADFAAVLRRHQLTGSRKIRWAAQHEPVTYVVFDLLQIRGRSLIRQTLRDRRRRLEELLSTASTECLLFSQGVEQTGQSFFDHVVAQGHEGVMAKRLDSRYLPGKRAASWRKIKPRQQVVCVVIGYRSNRHGGHELAPAGCTQGRGAPLCWRGRSRTDRSALAASCSPAGPVRLRPAHRPLRANSLLGPSGHLLPGQVFRLDRRRSPAVSVLPAALIRPRTGRDGHRG